MFRKVEVNGKYASPVFQYLKANLSSLLGQSIKWNFTKFLVNRQGKPVKRYSPATHPFGIKKAIVEELAKPASTEQTTPSNM